jgi:hypothetical protein
MSRIERRYERALAALKAIARAMANAAFVCRRLALRV